jgi:hypothetical protein
VKILIAHKLEVRLEANDRSLKRRFLFLDPYSYAKVNGFAIKDFYFD